MSLGLSCGEKYRMRYIEHIKLPPSMAMVRGRSVHKTNEINLSQKIESKKDMPLSDMLDCTRDSFCKTVSDGVLLTRDEISAKSRLLNECLEKSLTITEIYNSNVAPVIDDAVSIEKSFAVYVEDIDIVIKGRMDVKTKTGIRDLKITAQTMVADQIKTELQPGFYGLADSIESGRTETEFAFDNIVVKKIPTVTHQKITVGKAQHDIVKKKIAAFSAMVKAGIFLPPAVYPGWVCTPKYCGYHGMCNFTK
jgi:hypothetical protein